MIPLPSEGRGRGGVGMRMLVIFLISCCLPHPTLRAPLPSQGRGIFFCPTPMAFLLVYGEAHPSCLWWGASQAAKDGGDQAPLPFEGRGRGGVGSHFRGVVDMRMLVICLPGCLPHPALRAPLPSEGRGVFCPTPMAFLLVCGGAHPSYLWWGASFLSMVGRDAGREGRVVTKLPSLLRGGAGVG